MENKEFKRRNKNLATQIEKQKRIENDLLCRISQLEKKQLEDDVMLCGINRYWKVLDENCRIFSKQFDAKCSMNMFDKFDSSADSFLIQLSTYDVEELNEKLEKRVQISKQNVKKLMLSLYKLITRTNTLKNFQKNGVKLKPQNIKRFQQNIKLRKKIITLHKDYYTFNLRMKTKQDVLTLKETENDEMKNRIDNLQYQNTKMKAATDEMEHNLAELMDEIKQLEDADDLNEAEAIERNSSPVDTIDKSGELEKEIEHQRQLSEQYLQELQIMNMKQQEAAKQVETLKIDACQLPEKVIIQSKKYKYLQSKFSILYNESSQLRLSWEEVQKQMQILKTSFNAAQETSERECLVQQKSMRQEMIKLDDTNGQLRKECRKLKMELEQSVAETNLFGSLNSEMKKLMSSMLDYCKQHESDIKRYKRKHEEIEEDIRFSKAMPPMKIKCDKLLQLVRYREFHRRRLKEKELLKEGSKEAYLKMPPPKELRSRDVTKELNGKDIKPLNDSKDLMNAKEMQHIKNILNSKDISYSKISPSKDKDLFNDFLHPKESSQNCTDDPLHKGTLHYSDLTLRKEMHFSKSYSKLTYSKEVQRSKELLKERYLRDCSKMKYKELFKDGDKEDVEKQVEVKNQIEFESNNSEETYVPKTTSKIPIKESVVNLDSDDSGHDEPKAKKLSENKSAVLSKEKSEEETDCTENQNSDKSEFLKPENKDQLEVKKATPPTKKDLIVRKLKYHLKKIMGEKKDLNLLLGMYKNMNKTDEERVKLMVSEQKLKTELDEVKRQMRRIEESRCDDRKDLVDVVMTRKIKYLLAKRRRLQKKIEEARDSLLCGEMEITGQVWDELQAQNTRLHQLLREKDDENLKLMTERVKSNQLYNLSKEENETMMQHINFNNEKIETKSEIIQKLEERELAYRNRLTFFEQELVIRKKACEVNKRKAVENAQTHANLKRQLEKYQKLSHEVQQQKIEKSALLESKMQKNNSLLEEISQLKKKLERMKKYESVGTLEAILAEELREYKNILTCPSCKVNTKDAVLIKCFHVYCLNCIKTRYETRQRKCPECCAPFGANDYHRLFLFN
ncbi:E3 ubiquitin-protein ligase BRE1B-like [Planococcus citri]|uniref:E3 ubiquitin-protein ligase BRE1B-like n=1 Tax=Planococcus citri TaxID=170843 RepID=UPI0031F8E1E2